MALASALLATPRAAVAQPFPERPFVPESFDGEPVAADGSPIATWYATDIPNPADPAVAKGFLWDRAAMAACLAVLTGDDPPKAPDGAASSCGGQYLRATWLKEPAGEQAALAKFDSSIVAAPDEMAQCSVPLGMKKEGRFEFMRGGERILPPLTHDLGSHLGVMFVPRATPLASHSWTSNLMTDSRDGGLVFNVPVAARQFAIVDVQRPSSAPADAELALFSGASSRSIRLLQAPAPGFARLLVFPMYEAEGAVSLELGWMPKGVVGPPENRVRSTIENVYALGFGVARFFSERQYAAAEGETIELLPITAHPELKVVAFRASEPGSYEEVSKGFWVYKPARPVASVRVVFEAVYPFGGMDRTPLLTIRDDSYCEREEVRVEGPEADQLVDSGYQGLRWAVEEDESGAGRWTGYSLRRRFLSTDRRTGRWSAMFFHLAGGVDAQASHKMEATYFPDGIGVGEEIAFAVLSGSPEKGMPKPLRLEINRAVEERNLELSFAIDEPTTRTVLLADPSQAYPGESVTAVELEWEKPPRLAKMRLAYKALGHAGPPDSPETLPITTILGATSVVRAITVDGRTTMRLGDLGDYQEVPQYEPPAVLDLAPEPSDQFELRYMGSARGPLLPRRPTLFRESGQR